MATITVINLTRTIVSLPNPIGNVGPLATKSITATTSQVEACGESLVALENAGIIEFNVTVEGDNAVLDTSFYTALDTQNVAADSSPGALTTTDGPTSLTIGAITAGELMIRDEDTLVGVHPSYANAVESTVATTIIVVYVSSAGSDTLGDGSLAAPYATVHKALSYAPNLCGTTFNGTATTTYQIRVLAPYTAPLGTLTVPMANTFGPNFNQIRYQVAAWPTNEATFGTTSDERWTNLVSNLTPASAAQYSGNRLLYTVAPGTITSDDQYAGEFVRIFDTAGTTELCRGWIFRTIQSTQSVYIHTRQTFTAATTNRLFFCRPTVVLGATGSGFIQGSIIGRNQFDFHTVRFTDSISIQGLVNVSWTNSQLIANGGGGAVLGGPTAVIDGFTTTAISNFPAAESTLRQCPMFFRSAAGGFLGSGNIILGGVWIGNYQSNGNLATSIALGNCTFRGIVNGADFGRAIATISGTASTSAPLLVIPLPSATGGTFILTGESMMRMDNGSFMNVETSLCGGDLIRIRNRSNAFIQGTIRPAVSGAMAAGIVMNVTADGFGMINTASTIAGAGAVDVKAGGTAAVTFATLAGAGRTSEAATFATIISGTAF